jgi:hypothetical protein
MQASVQRWPYSFARQNVPVPAPPQRPFDLPQKELQHDSRSPCSRKLLDFDTDCAEIEQFKAQ